MTALRDGQSRTHVLPLLRDGADGVPFYAKVVPDVREDGPDGLGEAPPGGCGKTPPSEVT